ncbi:efflux RND transporter periplasmic adaptor subunit [Methylococcus sp. EFPC2]|uniref:efflux RND transporter periplasmic adaptor subunit n=1 Tax=Methylococcus sp. EFPC2 TaxID=2812648 RepID=UPI001967386F|nr:efflux RND transporter periplasmic adaptor subunit [Methylococcus sp. EFPC2]QSA96609.1 efflux RND transporter periplasmic adaptor subunit [Methylococcus sp. EFPC2]
MRMFKLTILAWLALGGLAQAQDNLLKMTPEQSQHIGIKTLKPQVTHQMPLARAPARVSLPPQNEQTVAAPVAGFVDKIEVALGVEVQAGQTLAQIRSAELLALQRAALDADTQLRLAGAKLNRDKTLLAEGIIAHIRYEETRADHERYLTAQKEADQLLTSVGMSAAEIRTLKRNHKLDGTLTVHAPFAGVILERLAAPGQRVDLLAPLFKVGKLDELWLEIDMPMERLAEARVGDSVAIENTGLNAHITHIGQAINPASQSALVRAVVSGRTDAIRPGQHVNVQLMHASSDDLFRLPIGALASQEGKDYVFVRVSGGYAPREVSVASKEEREAIIHAGLKPGDEVVVQGVAALKASWVGIGGGGD